MATESGLIIAYSSAFCDSHLTGFGVHWMCCSPLRWTLGLMGIPTFAAASTILYLIEQDEGRHKFGQSGGASSLSLVLLVLLLFISQSQVFFFDSVFITHPDYANLRKGTNGPVESLAGFHCPFVPTLPLASIFVNVYLLVNLG